MTHTTKTLEVLAEIEEGDEAEALRIEAARSVAYASLLPRLASLADPKELARLEAREQAEREGTWPTCRDWYHHWRFARYERAEWIDPVGPNRKRAITRMWDRFCDEPLGSVPMARCTLSHISKLLGGYPNHGGIRTQVATMLWTMFNDAAKIGWIDEDDGEPILIWRFMAPNPVPGGARKSKLRDSPVLTEEQLTMLVAEAIRLQGKSEAAACLAMLCCYGLRLEEINELTWAQVNVDNPAGQHLVGTLYWPPEVRKKPVPLRLPLTRSIYEMLPARGKPEERVWKQAKPTIKQKVCWLLDSAVSSLRLPTADLLTPQSLRYCVSSALEASGHTVRDIQTVLGHGSVQTTERYLERARRARTSMLTVAPLALRVGGGV